MEPALASWQQLPLLLLGLASALLPLSTHALPSLPPLYQHWRGAEEAQFLLYGKHSRGPGQHNPAAFPTDLDLDKGRSLLSAPAGSNPCANVVCPDISSCFVAFAGAAPQCVCPFFAPNLVNNSCVNGTLDPGVAQYLNPHNQARAAVGAMPMFWSSTLAAAAQAWATNSLSADCSNLYHGGVSGPGGTTYGQNLASEWGYSNVSNSFPVTLWLSEYQNYNFATNTCNPGQTCGHYTQVIWNASTLVGCATATCTWPGHGAGAVWVCNYSPAGNAVGAAPVNASLLSGACSPVSTAQVIPVYAESDIYRRPLYPKNSTVILSFYNNIRLSTGLNFNTSAWACTILQPAPGVTSANVFYQGWDTPVLFIQFIGNILSKGINYISNVTEDAPGCKPLGGSSQCPAIVVWKSFGVQIVQATVVGQVYVAGSVYVLLDSLNATQPPPKNPLKTPWRDGPIIWFQMTGVGQWTNTMGLVRSGNVLSNSIISGSNILVAMDAGAVGTRIIYNYMFNFGFAAVRCGNLVHFAFDCHKSLIAYNYIYRHPALPSDTLGDSGALYFSSKWFDPGNQVVCNYITGGDYCMYFDFASSGIEVIGGVCIGQKGVTMKFNTGKWNKVRHLVIIGYSYPQLISCICSGWFNCTSDPGDYYETLRRVLFNSPAINQAYPWLQTVCSAPNATSLDGTSCYPNGTQPIPCNILPYNNYNEYITVNRTTGPLNPLGFCTTYPAVTNLNSLWQWSFTDPQFWGNGDYGVQPTSPIYNQIPDFVSCPRSQVGPQPVDPQSYYDAFNIPVPFNYFAVRNAYYCFGYTCYGHPGFGA